RPHGGRPGPGPEARRRRRAGRAAGLRRATPGGGRRPGAPGPGLRKERPMRRRRVGPRGVSNPTEEARRGARPGAAASLAVKATLGPVLAEAAARPLPGDAQATARALLAQMDGGDATAFPPLLDLLLEQGLDAVAGHLRSAALLQRAPWRRGRLSAPQ